MTGRYLLDTNVLSELMRERPAADVLDWFARSVHATLHTSAIAQAEILTGIAMLPAGKRRTALVEAAEAMFEQDFPGAACRLMRWLQKAMRSLLRSAPGQGNPFRQKTLKSQPLPWPTR